MITRRDFIKGLGAAAGAAALPKVKADDGPVFGVDWGQGEDATVVWPSPKPTQEMVDDCVLDIVDTLHVRFTSCKTAFHYVYEDGMWWSKL